MVIIFVNAHVCIIVYVLFDFFLSIHPHWLTEILFRSRKHAGTLNCRSHNRNCPNHTLFMIFIHIDVITMIKSEVSTFAQNVKMRFNVRIYFSNTL